MYIIIMWYNVHVSVAAVIKYVVTSKYLIKCYYRVLSTFAIHIIKFIIDSTRWPIKYAFKTLHCIVN